MNLFRPLAIAIVALAAMLFAPAPAPAACGSLPNIFSNNVSTVDASTTNANNNFLRSCATSVDWSQIGANGIYASQIIPSSTATGTFGGSYPYTFSLNTAGQTPLSIVGYTSQGVDLFDVFSANRTTKYAWIDAGGALHTNVGPTFNGTSAIQVNGVGPGMDHILSFSNQATTKPDSADSLGAIYAYAPSLNSGCSSGQAVSEMWPGVAGASGGNYGGYWVFWTKADGACSGNEVLVLTAGAHIYPAGPAIANTSTTGCSGTDSQGVCQITTPATCSAGAPCGTVTVNFGTPFLQPDGTTHEQPYCTYAIQDTNTPANAWSAVPETMAYNTQLIGYAPLIAQSLARTLNIYWHCYASSY